MSKVGKQPISIPDGVTVTVADGVITVKGPKGDLAVPLLAGVEVAVQDGTLQCTLNGTGKPSSAKATAGKPSSAPAAVEKALAGKKASAGKQARSNWGTMRALLANAITGLTEGFEKTLILEGVGYRITKEGDHLLMSLGFSHPVRYEAPAGIAFEVEKNSILKVRGIDRALVGQVAAEIRALKKPEPYRGKGFRYHDEVIKRKVGKKAGVAKEASAAGGA